MNNLTALLPVADQTVGEELKKTVNARQLHKWLGVGKDFSTWINNRIHQYGFEEDKDFVVVEGLSSPNLANSKSGRSGFPPDSAKTCKRGSGEYSPDLGKTSKGGRPSIEYHLATGMAKELSMVENNEKGREARRYFIQVEEAARRAAFKHSYDEVLTSALHFRELSRTQEKIIAAVIPSNLHLYGTVDDDGKPYTGLRRGSVTKALHRLKDAAAFNLHISQLEFQLACTEATA